MLKVFMVYMIFNAGISLLLGVLTLSGVESSCTAAQSPDACSNVAIVTGVILTVGSSTLGLFAALTSWLLYLGWQDAAQGPAGAQAAGPAAAAAAAAGSAAAGSGGLAGSSSSSSSSSSSGAGSSGSSSSVRAGASGFPSTSGGPARLLSSLSAGKLGA
jgi:hypothetical protein